MNILNILFYYFCKNKKRMVFAYKNWVAFDNFSNHGRITVGRPVFTITTG